VSLPDITIYKNTLWSKT